MQGNGLPAKKRSQSRVLSWLWPKNGGYKCSVKSITAFVQPKVAIQSLLRPALTPVSANKDYEEFRRIIETSDRLLIECHLEKYAIDFALDNLLKETPDATARVRERYARQAVKALRTNVLRKLLAGVSFRKFSFDVYRSDLLADFCRVRDITGIKGLSKSEVGRMLKFFPEDQLRLLHNAFTEICANSGSCGLAGLEEPVDASLEFFDTTCLDANIHFPVDWVLLKDVAATLLQSVILIRRAGLFCRMPQVPELFTREMNRLCIEMTHSARRQDGKKARKQVLRRMKSLLDTIGGHARRHREELDARWEETEYTEAQKDRIVARIDDMLGKLPLVKKQAHERIIGGRQVSNADKILSVHESDLHVIVRRKAGKEVEFGNTLLLCESANGYILDWQLYRERAPSESDQLLESLERQSSLEIETPILAACTDRGFNSKKCSAALRGNGIYDATCSRDPATLKARMGEKLFADLQRRRGSTEARIAILNQKLGGRLRQKGFANRSLAVGWAVLAHNLWLIARLLAQQDAKARAAA